MQKKCQRKNRRGFFILNKKFGVQTELGLRINTNLTRVEIANWIGAAKETVIREIIDFKSEKLINEDDDYFYIINYDKLKGIAGLTN